jgi:hypothetical protein
MNAMTDCSGAGFEGPARISPWLAESTLLQLA